MSSFNKTDAAVFLMQTVLPGGYPFSQLNYVLGVETFMTQTRGHVCHLIVVLCDNHLYNP